ncbi:AraC family transcriptional regulator [Paenibacillus agaridevorans]|uniref:AraC family transcriptional regulator n=1 Tax=Paenibacillus agaridevorans TaxID=171404 RepID=UPI001BE4BD84|nr:AraC family transcriptional regulator [Paenibacillus agaridevorans]
MKHIELSFRSHLFTFVDMEYRACSPENLSQKLFVHHYSLIAVMQGRGAGMIDGKRIRLIKGHCFLAAPGALLEVDGAESEGLAYYRLAFRIERIASTEEQGIGLKEPDAEEEILRLEDKLHVQPFGQWASMLEELYRHREHKTGLEGYRQHIRLQELLYYLCERNDGQSERNPRSAVSGSIDKLHEDITRIASVKQLAQLANIGVRQYTYLFKELTGRSPVDYMTELRMNEAKKRLLVSNDDLNTIARNAGFQDVYYFSRRFKQMVGMAPKHFVAKRRRELRIVALYYAGILMSIGVKPVGANLTWWGGSEFLKEQERNIVDVGAQPSLEKIAGLEPDLILMNDTHSQYYGQFSKIAPTVIIPYDGKRGIYEDIRLVGELIDRPQAAEQFVARYELKAEKARAALTEAGITGGDSPATIIRLEGGGSQFSVFGDNYGRSGWAVYRGLGLAAPAKVRQLIESGTQIVQGLPIDRLPEYAESSRYLFVVNEGEGIGLMRDRDLWNGLAAVRGDRVFELGKEQFAYFDPVSVEAQLELLTEMLIFRGS